MFFFELKPKDKQKNPKNFPARPQERRLYSWRNIRTAKEPMRTQTQRRVWELKKGLGERTGLLFNDAKVFCVDHWHLLIRSAAKNHLRIQECRRKPDAGEYCNLSFGSYSQLKRYQKKVRLITYSSSTTVLSILVAMAVVQLFFPSLKSQGATYIFNQTGWSGGATGNSAIHPGNQTGWNQYASKDASVSVVNGGNDVQLALPAANSVQDDSDAQFNGTQSGDGFYTDGTGKLYLKKPAGYACTGANQCASGTCTSNLCI